TTQPELAQKFAAFVASDEGKAIFEKSGFPAYPNEKYMS
ncbi:MAG TPA: substrate-binding domain-containing protein, partial [Methanocorpusculum sp.]|nr:substrate-binding domain-containing protein [Methanocorpusculum sp.]